MLKLTELYRQTLLRIIRDDNTLRDFLALCGRLYKYDFARQVLIFTQREDATAVATGTIWIAKMHRGINKGAKAIKVLNDRANGWDELFDVTDTSGGRETLPKMWRMTGDDIPGLLERMAGEAFAEQNQPPIALDMLRYILYSRAGQEDSISLPDRSDIRGIDRFEDLGIAVSQMAETVLRKIERGLSDGAHSTEWHYLSDERRRELLRADRSSGTDGDAWEVRNIDAGVSAKRKTGAVSEDDYERQPVGLFAGDQYAVLGEVRQDRKGNARGHKTAAGDGFPRGGAQELSDRDAGGRDSAERDVQELNFFTGAAVTAAPFLLPQTEFTDDKTTGGEFDAHDNTVDEPSANNAGDTPESQEAERGDAVSQRGLTPLLNYHCDKIHVSDGAKTKCAENIEAIRMLKKIESENRLATPDEQQILARYTGWGGIPQVFDVNAAGWSAQYNELRTLLDDVEYAGARASTPNAHYTSDTVIGAIYSALDSFGFKGGRILEPSMGVGYFFALLPETMRESTLTGVELDGISGRIARQLYQNADIRIQGFESSEFADGSFDVAIGNVPFGAYKVADVKYDSYNLLIHDYFVAKSLDKLRAGGILAFVTTKGTLDKENQTLRRYIAKRAELIGAIRLPNDAFKQTANTEVTTDIIFLQKREIMSAEEPEWLSVDSDANGIPVNRYFLSHPEMLLGEMAFDKSMYGSEKLTTCKPFPDRELRELIAPAVSRLSAAVTQLAITESTGETSMPAVPGVRNFTYTVVDGEIYYRVNEIMERKPFSGRDAARVKGLDAIRLSVLEVIEAQRTDLANEQISAAQEHLNTVYDAFVEQFGAITDRVNLRAFHEDSDLCLLSALEERAEGGVIRKADIFSRRTIRSAQLAQTADSAQDALTLSINYRRGVDLGYMRRVYGKTEEEIIEELGDEIYQDPEKCRPDTPLDGWETSDAYLSGNVRDKLAAAKLCAAEQPERFMRNVRALESVQPKWLEATEIDVRLGATWIDVEYIDKFIYELLGTPKRMRGDSPRHLHAVYNRHQGCWAILNAYTDAGNVAATQSYGSDRMNAYEIIECTLNLKSAVVRDAKDNGNGGVTYVVNHKQSVIARSRQETIKSAFKSWIFSDAGRRGKLVTYYNEHFNCIVPRKYDGSRLILPGINPLIELQPHQLNAIARCISGDGNALLAHVVGAGKTYTMIAAAHEQVRLGMASKAAFVVPNHLTEQFGSDIFKLYPDAKVLISSKADFEKENRQRFLSRIAMSDVEFVVIGHSQFERIPMSDEFRAREIDRQIDEIIYAIEDIKRQRGENYSIKQLEVQRKSLEAELKKLNDTSKKDRQVTFDQLGIDSLFVDEAHYYKNLAVFSKMRNVAGISNAHAKKASDMLMKVNYVNDHDGVGGIVTFATGTPISNSMAEMYVMQLYLQPKTLHQFRIHHFDEWAAQFGETITSLELAPEGNGYRPRTRFAKFHNLPELMSAFRQVADIQTADMLNLPRPQLAGGKPIVVKSIPSSSLDAFMAEGIARVERIHNGSVLPWEDNMLKFTTDAKKAGLDMRLIDPTSPFDHEGKISQCAKNVYRHYIETMEQRGVQLVFCDTSTPKKSGFDVYTEFKQQAVSLGVPEEKIAFIHDANTDLRRDLLFAQCRSGEIRVLLGSTQKCGAGTNIQDRLIALHHLDCPYRPSDIEQREGRILRRGNVAFDEVYIYRYVTERSFDAYLWSIVETKAKFISQIMTSKDISRSCEDMDEAVLSYAEVKAIASGDPRIKAKLDIDMEVTRLTTLKTEHDGQRYRLEDELRKAPGRIAAAKQKADNIQKDIDRLAEHPMPEFQIELDGHILTERETAGNTLHMLAKNMKPYEERPVGTFRGFNLALFQQVMFEVQEVHIIGALTYSVELSFDNVGAITRLENTLKKLDGRFADELEKIESLCVDMEKLKSAHDHPFEFEDDLKELIERQTKLDYELNLNNNEGVIDDDTDAPGEGEQEMTVIFVEPGKPARTERFRGELKEMQAMVGGSIETVHPFEDGSAVLVCNRDGKNMGLTPNRTIRGDVVAGNFFICAETEAGDDFTSPDRRQMKKYLDMFKTPEAFNLSAGQEDMNVMEY